jgi:cell division transport system ATP-binding protein
MEEKVLIKYSEVELCQQEHIVLKNIDIEIKNGQFIFLLGDVGSGKSTFLKSLYAEVPITNGEASVIDFNLKKIKRKQIPLLRRKIGIVFQDFKLLTDRDVKANLLFVLRATGWKDKKAMEEQIQHILKQVGMENKGYKMPHQLSGGEQQRIVIARALLNSPEIILADEPTGNLDNKAGKDIIELLHSISQSGTTVIIATHNMQWVEQFKGEYLHCKDDNLYFTNNVNQFVNH